MSQRKSEFQAVIERICDGSDEAVWEFLETYGPHVQRAVRRQLHQSLRSKFDSIDFTQMVWASFFSHPKQIAAFRNPAQLTKYLVSMAQNKVRQEGRRRSKYQRYNVRRERALDEANQSLPAGQSPSHFAMANETLRGLMDQQKTDRNRQIVRMRISGKTFLEIGQSLGIHERTARQVIAEIAGSTI